MNTADDVKREVPPQCCQLGWRKEIEALGFKGTTEEEKKFPRYK